MIISKITASIEPQIYPYETVELAITVQSGSGQTLSTRHLLGQNDIESRFEYCMARLTEILRCELKKQEVTPDAS